MNKGNGRYANGIVVQVKSIGGEIVFFWEEAELEFTSLAAAPLYAGSIAVEKADQNFLIKTEKKKGSSRYKIPPFLFNCSADERAQKEIGLTHTPIISAAMFEDGDRLTIKSPALTTKGSVIKVLLWMRPDRLKKRRIKISDL